MGEKERDRKSGEVRDLERWRNESPCGDPFSFLLKYHSHSRKDFQAVNSRKISAHCCIAHQNHVQHNLEGICGLKRELNYPFKRDS